MRDLPARCIGKKYSKKQHFMLKSDAICLVTLPESRKEMESDTPPPLPTMEIFRMFKREREIVHLETSSSLH